MSKHKKLATLAILLVAGATVGCRGYRETGTTITAHAECFRLFGWAIPDDDQAAARELIPTGATITNIESTPADTTSIMGLFGNLFWFHRTTIGAEK